MKTKFVVLVGIVLFAAAYFLGVFVGREEQGEVEVNSHKIVIFDKAISLEGECVFLAEPSVNAGHYAKYMCETEDYKVAITMQKYSASSLQHLEKLDQEVEIRPLELGSLNAVKIELELVPLPSYQICDDQVCMIVQPAPPKYIDKLLSQLQ